jgi:hypothetical protein
LSRPRNIPMARRVLTCRPCALQKKGEKGEHVGFDCSAIAGDAKAVVVGNQMPPDTAETGPKSGAAA